MNNQSIFSIKFEKYTAELEINKSSLKCVTGEIIHFNIPLQLPLEQSTTASQVQISHNKCLQYCKGKVHLHWAK